MVKSFHGNAFCIADSLWRESPDHHKGSVVRINDIPLLLDGTTIEQTVELPVIIDATMLMWRHCYEDGVCQVDEAIIKK